MKEHCRSLFCFVAIYNCCDMTISKQTTTTTRLNKHSFIHWHNCPSEHFIVRECDLFPCSSHAYIAAVKGNAQDIHFLLSHQRLYRVIWSKRPQLDQWDVSNSSDTNFLSVFKVNDYMNKSQRSWNVATTFICIRGWYLGMLVSIINWQRQSKSAKVTVISDQLSTFTFIDHWIYIE